MDFKIRIATIDDIDSIGKLWIELHKDQLGKDPYYSGDLEFTFDRQHCEEVLNNPQSAIFVSEVAQSVVGFIEIHQYNQDTIFFIDDYAYILYAYIEHAYRFSASGLYKAAEDWAISKGSKYLQADVFRNNKNVEGLLEFAEFRPYITRYAKKLT